MIEIIQVNISGEDKPGLTTALTSILAQYDATILDIGQENIHKSLTLGILFLTTPEKSGFIMKDLLFKASELGVQIRFTPIEREAYDAWVARQGKNRYIVTLLGRTVTARQIADVTAVIFRFGLNIDAIRRLTGRPPIEGVDERAAKACIEISVRGMLGDEERAAMQNALLGLPKSGLDISFQKDDIYRRSRRLICFDMDSTLVHTECIDELAARAGVGDQVKAITARAMRGEIDFTESFTQRVALLKGLDVNVMEEIAHNLPFNEGLERMMKILKMVGYKTAILSGGFTFFREIPAAEVRLRLCLCQRAGNRGRQTHGQVRWGCGGRPAQGRTAASALPGREHQSGAVGGCRRRRQRSADAFAGGPGHCLSCQAQGAGERPAEHHLHRPGRHPILPRSQGFAD